MRIDRRGATLVMSAKPIVSSCARSFEAVTNEEIPAALVGHPARATQFN
jgi:hypothetical protein